MNTLSSGYRPWIWPWFKHYLMPRTYYYYVKYKWQRAQRGWADCDTWSLDDYLINWLPDALQHLKESQTGIPNQAFPVGSEFKDEHGNYTDGAYKIAEKNWNEIMDKMIAGFRVKQRMSVLSYELEIGSYPHSKKFLEDGYTKSWITEEQNGWFDKMRPLEARDEKIFKEGFALFVEHFESLWD